MANFRSRFQFVHDGKTYDAILLAGDDHSPTVAGVCHLCKQSLRPGRHYYVTVPFLFYVHGDCAAAEASTVAEHDDAHVGRGLPRYHPSPSPSRPYMISCPPPPYSNPAEQYRRPYCYPPPPPPPPPPYYWPPNYSYPYNSTYPPPPPQPQAHQANRTSVTGIITKVAVAVCVKSFLLGMLL